MQGRQERMARAVLSAGVGTCVTAAAHAAGGGTFPPPLLFLLVFVLGVLACFGLGGRRVTLPRLVLAVGAVQGLLHALFSMAGAMAAPTTSATTGGHGHLHDAVMVMPGDLGDHDGSMVGSHVVAGLVTIASLRLGTAAVRQLGRALLVRLVTLVASVVALEIPHRPSGAPRVDDAPRRPVSLRLATSRVLRGPPAAATT